MKYFEKINPPKYYINGISLRKYCRENNLPYGSIRKRVLRGMSIEEALDYKQIPRYSTRYNIPTDWCKHFDDAQRQGIRKQLSNGCTFKDAVVKSRKKEDLLKDCRTLAQKLLQVKPELKEWLEINYKEYL